MKDWNWKPIKKDMARKPKRRNVDRELHGVVLVLIMVALVIVIGVPMATMAIVNKTAPEVHDGAPVGAVVTNTPFHPITETAAELVVETAIPTATEVPTKAETDEPTPTPTEPAQTPENTATVAPVVMFVIPTPYPTFTPYPTYTPFPSKTPDPEPTIPAVVQERDNIILNRIRMANLEMGIKETMGSAPMLFIYGLIVLAGIAWLVPGRWIEADNKKLKQEGKAMARAATVDRSGEFDDALDLIERSILYSNPKDKKLLGWRKMNLASNKWSAEHWSKVIKQMDELGLRTIRQSGVGTVLAETDLRGARSYIAKVVYSWSDGPNQTTSPPMGMDG